MNGLSEVVLIIRHIITSHAHSDDRVFNRSCKNNIIKGVRIMGMNSRFKLSLFMILIVALFVVAGCSSSVNNEGNVGDENESSGTPVQGGELTVGYYSDASSYDPLLASSGGDESLLYLIYDRLIDYGPDFEPIPGLAESWENIDSTTWVLNLQKGVTFHDGTDFDAEAVKLNIERANSDSSNKSDLNSIESVEVTDSHTVTLHLNEPNSGLLQALMTAAGMMVSPTAIEKHGDEYALHPVGTGPFKIVDRIPDQEIKFERFSDHWREDKPYLDEVTVKVMKESTMVNALKSGEVDLIAPISATNKQDLEASANIKVNASPSLNFQYIYINTALPPLDNQKVRQALQYAIDREQLVNAIQFGEGEPAFGIFPKEHPAVLAESAIKYDQEKAKKLLEESGVENLAFDMLVKPDSFDVRIAEAVQAALAEVGIEVNIKPTEVTKLVELAFSKAEYPATLARASGRPDPNALISLYYDESSFYNPGEHANSELKTLIKKASEEIDADERMKYIAESNRIAIEEDAMGIPLFFEPMIVAFNENVKGYEPHQYGKARFQFVWLDN